MRLIDADELINILEWNKEQEKDALVSINSLIKLIKERPTAYDVNKVIEAINSKINKLDTSQAVFMECGLFGVADTKAKQIAIYVECRKIVEGGGINVDTTD